MRFPDYFPRLFRPSVYQGKRNPTNYFEGWYFKLVNADSSQIWGIIPGVSYTTEDTHAFVQVLEGISGRSFYYRFPIDSFSFSKRNFEVEIENNLFSAHWLKLDLQAEKQIKIKGSVELTQTISYPQKLIAPGIMGWYSFVPGMECYHGVVSVHNKPEGQLSINEEPVIFTGGKGYIEKDWGRSMPSDWIWVQSNHFEGYSDASFMISVARIPWKSGFFPGFLCFLSVEGKIFRFATYNRSKIDNISVCEKEIHIKLSNNRYKLNIIAKPNKSGKLKAPRHGSMDRDIFESLNSILNIVLTDSQGKVLFNSEGLSAGLEIVGDISKYI